MMDAGPGLLRPAEGLGVSAETPAKRRGSNGKPLDSAPSSGPSQRGGPRVLPDGWAAPQLLGREKCARFGDLEASSSSSSSPRLSRRRAAGQAFTGRAGRVADPRHVGGRDEAIDRPSRRVAGRHTWRAASPIVGRGESDRPSWRGDGRRHKPPSPILAASSVGMKAIDLRGVGRSGNPGAKEIRHENHPFFNTPAAGAGG